MKEIFIYYWLEKFQGDNGIVVYSAKPKEDDTPCVLVEWTPDPENFAAARKKFIPLKDRENPRGFAHNKRLYLLVSDYASVGTALQRFRQHGLFGSADGDPILPPPVNPTSSGVSAPPGASDASQVPKKARSLKSRHTLWPLVVACVLLGLWCTPRRLPTPPPKLLKFGIYDWLDEEALQWAADKTVDVHIEERLADLVSPDHDSLYDLVSVPITALANNKRTTTALKKYKWRIVWVSTRSEGAERILASADVMRDRRSIHGSKIAVIRDTFSDNWLSHYLETQLSIPNHRHILHAPSAAELKRQVEQDDYAAIGVPVGVPRPKDSLSDLSLPESKTIYLNVILARQKLLDTSSRTLLIQFVRKFTTTALSHINEISGLNDQLRMNKLRAYPSFKALDEGSQREALQSFKIQNIFDNIQFFYRFGAVSCREAVSALKISNSHENPEPDTLCDMNDTWLVSTMAKEEKLQAEEMKEFCLAGATRDASRIIDDFVPGHDELPKNNRLPAIREKVAGEQVSHCVVGHADQEGSPDENLTLGQKRAQRTVDNLEGEARGLSLFPLSLGDTHPRDRKGPSNPKNRRIEVWTLPILLNFQEPQRPPGSESSDGSL